MLGTFAVSWFGFAFLCWLALRQVTISDSEVALALMEIVYWSAVTVFLPPHYCARILLVARRLSVVFLLLHFVSSFTIGDYGTRVGPAQGALASFAVPLFRLAHWACPCIRV